MITTFTISTPPFSRTTLRRWVLGAACLLVMVGLQSCRSAVTTQASVALNTYQTAQTLPVGAVAFRVIGPPNFTSSFGAELNRQAFSAKTSSLAMFNQGLDMEIGLGNRLDAGCAINLGFDFVDYSLSARPYLKMRLTENATPFISSVLVGGEFIAGSKSSENDIWQPFGHGNVLSFDSLKPSWSGSLQSHTWKVFISIPMNIAVPSLWNEDIIIHPGVHFLGQTIISKEQEYYGTLTAPSGTKTIVLYTTDKVQTNQYLIPSLSIGLRSRNQPMESIDFRLHPEMTIALAGGTILWNVGLSFQFGKFGEELP